VHVTANHAPLTVTGSLKVMPMLASSGTPVAPSAGRVEATCGPVAHGASGDDVLRGAGAPAAKSAALLSVSVQPPSARKAAVVLLSVGAAPLPSKKFAVP